MINPIARWNSKPIDRIILSMSSCADLPSYLTPYIAASQKYGAGFGSLLWASPKTQSIRFKALLQTVDINGLSMMDVGCGRADLLEYIFHTRRCPRSYIGLEAVEVLATAARKKLPPHCQILHGDFVENPTLLETGADVLLYSGSLNTMDSKTFYQCLESGFAAAKRAMVFNFLCSPLLAGAGHLTWHPVEAVMEFSRGLSGQIKLSSNYMRGDATIALFKDSK
jgi:hypothetical protein